MERDDGGTAGSGNENMHANPGRTYTLTENNLNMHDFSEAATWNADPVSLCYASTQFARWPKPVITSEKGN